jgi:hypothetical protein
MDWFIRQPPVLQALPAALFTQGFILMMALKV